MFHNPSLSRIQPDLASVLERRVGLQLRFRHDAITVLLQSREEIGVLDRRMESALRSLKEADPIGRFELFVTSDNDRGSRSRYRQKPQSIFQVQIILYGSAEAHDRVGWILSNACMYLQEPATFDRRVTYRNPHFLCWDKPETPLLASGSYIAEDDFATKVETILETSTTFALPPSIEQDARISTKLRGHQMAGLHFMLTRESKDQKTFFLWEQSNVNDKVSFVHNVTGDRTFSKPSTCQGGILADEMGLGKSLTLIALIMHTVNAARSASQTYQDESSDRNGRPARSRSTLIIAPKSSKVIQVNPL
ncbi:hypothetical protein ACLMJK_000544 [Lecanora helva]